MTGIEKIASKTNEYALIANAAISAIAALVEVMNKSQGPFVTEEQIDAEIAKIDAEVQTASQRDWERLRGGG